MHVNLSTFLQTCTYNKYCCCCVKSYPTSWWSIGCTWQLFFTHIYRFINSSPLNQYISTSSHPHLVMDSCWVNEWLICMIKLMMFDQSLNPSDGCSVDFLWIVQFIIWWESQILSDCDQARLISNRHIYDWLGYLCCVNAITQWWSWITVDDWSS